jgi:nucleoside-diphosphate kinase
MSRFTKETSEVFYGEHIGKAFFPNLQEFITSDVVVGMELVASNAITKWRTFIGPTNTEKARIEAPQSLRALYGTDGTKNAVHGSDSPISADREINFFFGSEKAMKTTAVLNNCSLCIIKPHIIKNGQAGQALDMILQAGFEISAAEMFYLNRPQVEEFYDVYKGVLPEYLPLVEHMSNGPTILLEVRQEDAVQQFRNLVGPYDPVIAQHLQPETLRAKFGENRVKNGVHCTDLPEDGRLECQYFFDIMQAH